jgi:type I restriction enzyme S subunit
MSTDWITAKFKDCFNLKSGDGLTAKKMVPGDYDVFGGNGVAGKHNDFNLSGDNVIVGRVGALCGNARHITEDIWLTDNAFKITKPMFEFNNKFLTYLLNYKNLRSLARQAAQPVISNSSLADLELSFPNSIEEQKRIVTILDQVFADIEKARATAETNLKNARELFDSYLEKVSLNKKSLGKYVTIKTGKLDSNAAVEGGKYPFFTCSREVFEIDSFSFDCEAILLAGNNAVGNFNVKHYSGKFDAYQRTYVITIESDLDYRFLYYQMIKSLKELKNSSVGAGTKFLKIGMIKDLKISVPSIKEQEELVITLDKLNDSTERLARIYKRKLEGLEELKKSILQKAFNGELTKSKGIAA